MSNHINVPLWVVVGASAYSILLLVIGAYSYRELDLNMEDYMVASRRVGVGLVGITLIASFMSAVLLVGVPGDVRFNGIGFPGIFILFLFLIGLTVWVIGARIWALGARYGHITPADLMGDMFGDNRLRVVVAVLLVFWMFVFGLAQFVGAATVLNIATDGLVSFELGLVWIAAVVGLYIAYGGMRGSVLTDLIQTAFFVIIVFGLFFFIANVLTPGGFLNVFAEVSETNPDLLTYQFEGVVWTSFMFLSYGLFGTAGLFITPYMFQRFYLASSVENLRRSAVVYTFSWLLWIPAIFFGLVAVLQLPEVTNPDQIAARLALGAGALSVIVYSIGALAASMSTADSITFAIGSITARDILEKVIKPDISEAKLTRYSQYIMVLVVAALLVVGLVPRFRANVIPLAVLAIAGWSQIGFPVLVSMIWTRANGEAILSGIVVGTALLILLFFRVGPTINGFHVAIWAGIANLIVLVLVSFLIDDDPDHVKYEYYYHMNEELAKRKGS